MYKRVCMEHRKSKLTSVFLLLSSTKTLWSKTLPPCVPSLSSENFFCLCLCFRTNFCFLLFCFHVCPASCFPDLLPLEHFLSLSPPLLLTSPIQTRKTCCVCVLKKKLLCFPGPDLCCKTRKKEICRAAHFHKRNQKGRRGNNNTHSFLQSNSFSLLSAVPLSKNENEKRRISYFAEERK